MWYSKLIKTSSTKLDDHNKNILNSYGRKIYQEICDNSETAEDDEIIIWFNSKNDEWLVSSGDWSKTTSDTMEDAINKFAKDIYKELNQQYKKPQITFEAELGDPGEPWFRLDKRFMIKNTK